MHRRRAIREAVVALVTGLSTTGSNVTEGRVYPVAVTATPSIDVTTTEESREFYLQSTTLDETRLTIVEITIRAEGDDYPSQLDDIALEIEQAIGSDRDLGGLVNEFRLSSTSTESSNEVGETPIGQMVMSWEARYSVASIDPQ